MKALRTPILTLVALAVLLGVATTASAQPPADASEDQKLFYALGVVVSQNLGAFDLSDDELKMVLSGIEDGVAGKEHGMDLSKVMPRIQAMAQDRAQKKAEEERGAAAEFVTQMGEEAKAKGGEVSDSGLVYIPVTEGTGVQPAATDRVTVHYHGTLRDGTVFDSSVDRGQPATFGLNQVIPCWTEGVQKIKVGGKAKLVCPPDIAYGDRAAGKIPPGSALVFEVELLEIVDAGGE